MNGKTFAIFNAVRFSSPPVERGAVLLNQREFHTEFDFCGCQHVFGPDKANCGEAVANFHRIIGVIFTLQNHPTNTKSFYALGNKHFAN